MVVFISCSFSAVLNSTNPVSRSKMSWEYFKLKVLKRLSGSLNTGKSPAFFSSFDILGIPVRNKTLYASWDKTKGFQRSITHFQCLQNQQKPDRLCLNQLLPRRDKCLRFLYHEATKPVFVFPLDGMLVHGKVPPSIKEARSRYFRYFSQLWVLKVKLAEQWCFICKFTQQMRMILKLCKWNFDVNWNKLALTWSRADVFKFTQM